MCVKPLREDVEYAIATDGWNKASMHKMRKLDHSFLKECSYGRSKILSHGQPVSLMDVVSVVRKAMKDLSDRRSCH